MGSSKVLTDFLNGCFSYGKNSVWRSQAYSRLLLKASAHNTYAETVKAEGLPDADSLNRRIAMTGMAVFRHAFLSLTTPCLDGLKHKGVIVIVDIGYEPFYGWTANSYIHPYRPVRGAAGCFEYLNVSIIAGEKRLFIDSLPVFTVWLPRLNFSRRLSAV